jgi:hypothetical protein
MKNFTQVAEGLQKVDQGGFMAYQPAWYPIMHEASATTHCLYHIPQSTANRAYTTIYIMREKNVHEGHSYRDRKKDFNHTCWPRRSAGVPRALPVPACTDGTQASQRRLPALRQDAYCMHE